MRIAYAGTVCNGVARGGDSAGWGSSPELTIVEADTPSQKERGGRESLSEPDTGSCVERPP